VESSGKPLTLADLKGKVWIADFVFTQCGSICPRMTAQMSALQRQMQKRQDWKDIRLVSFSVDPEHDTPAVLRDYAKGFEAEPGHWLFLTGRQKAVWTLVRQGFKLPVESAEAGSTSPILHSGKFVLVDREGRIRGYYSGLESTGRDKLVAALNQVLKD
jgi:protein SCO1